MKALTYFFMFGFAFALGCGGSTSTTATKNSEEAATPSIGSESEDLASKQTQANETASGSYDSPQSVFQAFSKAIDKDDWQSAISMLTPESQEMIVTGMVMQASFMTMEDEKKGKELEQLFKKYGLDEESADDELGDAEMVDVSKLVKNLPAFIGELSAWIKVNEPEPQGGFPKLDELSDVTIEGDKATAMTKTEMGQRPIDFQKVDGSWKVHLATGPPPAPSVDDLGLDFEDTRDGTLGWMQLGDKSSGLNHAFAYHAKFFEDPCIVLVLSAEEISEEQQKELEADLKEEDGDAMFFADGPHVKLTLSPEGELISMHVWIDNSSMSGNRGPAVDIQMDGDTISGRAGMAPEEFGDEVLQFQAKFDTSVRF